jgi:hypothetical protein
MGTCNIFANLVTKFRFFCFVFGCTSRPSGFDTPMFRRTIANRISAFSIFLMDHKGHPKLSGLSVPKRGKRLGELYRALSVSEKQALTVRAAQVPKAPSKKTKSREEKRATRKPSAYNIFVKEHMSKFEGSLPDRIRKVSALWNKKKK